MEFNLEHCTDMLSRTPRTLEHWLRDFPAEWVHLNEGQETWSPFDIVGHLVHGEKTDWLPRLKIILTHGTARAFDPFDRFAQFDANQGRDLNELLDEFARLRGAALEGLNELQLTPEHESIEGRHPELGVVTLSQLIATWTVHDLTHIAQLARVIAVQYDAAVGPWKQYLGVLNRR